MMKIERVEIKGLFEKKDTSWKLNPQVNVLVGENGSGKSTILSIIYCMLNDIPNSHRNMIFDFSKIYFEKNNIKPIFRKNDTKPQFIDIDKISKDFAENIHREISNNIFEAINRIIPNTSKNKDKIINNFKEQKNELREKILQDIQKKIKKNAQEIDGRTALIVRHTEQIVENKDIFNKFNITMISTLNLSANAIFEFKGSNEEVLNILDLEMDKVLNQFNQKNNLNIQNNLMNELNFFLNKVNKGAEYRNHSIVYFDKDIKKELKFSDLSSGERQLVYILVQVALNATEKEKISIILMDEPEISLHLDWQEHFIKRITILNPNAQLIIVTHSPALIMNGWNDVYVDMKDIAFDMEQTQS